MKRGHAFTTSGFIDGRHNLRFVSSDNRPEWMQANPGAIDASVQRALAQPSGGWFVVASSRSLRPHSLRRRAWTDLAASPRSFSVDGRDIVMWRPQPNAALLAGPAACPHLGADLGTGHISNGCLVCPWHGLGLTDRNHGAWKTFPVHDDGVLVWVQPQPSAPDATDAPLIAKRPDIYLEGIVTRAVICEPCDIIANRLDPWHGTHLHPYSFRNLVVVDMADDHIDMQVTYRIVGSQGVDVTARFHVPEPRTIVMTIVDGEGTGSVVETHASPAVHAGPGRPPLTNVIEAILVTSERPGFIYTLRGARIARPLITFAANRLWTDDAAYAARRYALRSSGWVPGQ